MSEPDDYTAKCVQALSAEGVRNVVVEHCSIVGVGRAILAVSADWPTMSFMNPGRIRVYTATMAEDGLMRWSEVGLAFPVDPSDFGAIVSSLS